MAPRILTISPGLPFLPTLAQAILQGRVVPGFRLGDDPLSLADVTVLVPTRRAAQGLTAAFAHAVGGASAILPSVRPLGQDEEEPGLLATGDALTRLPPVEPLRRRLELARLIRFWKRQLDSGAASALSGTPIVLPASSADALRLAEDLAALLDEAGDEEVALSSLASLGVEDRVAHWWQLTLTFLSILTEHWPAHLAASGFCEPSEARRAIARERAERYRLHGARGPVIVAGSTATAPATLALMRAIAEMENGAVVLPGLDRDLDAASFARIDRASAGSAAGHPQYGLSRVLAGLGVTREDVLPLGPADPRAARMNFVSDALRPAETTDLWGTRTHGPEAVAGLALLEAPDERAEALAIAVAMREALSTPGRRVALTTPDRNLARRVVADLARFGIAANDSAGRPFATTPPGTLARLALEAALDPGDPVTILSLLKHPLTRLGMDVPAVRRGARAIELIALRGGTGRATAADLAALYRARRRSSEERGARVSRAVRLVNEEDRDFGQAVAEALARALEPLGALASAPPAETSAFAHALTQSLEALGRGEDGSLAYLYAEEAGGMLATVLGDLVAAPEVDFAVKAAEWPDVFRALAAGVSVRPRAGLSSRAFVWGTLEARLQDVDLMILGGLNEGTWPGGARSDAFLSRLMRAEILLDPPERRIGLSAHDFWMAMGHERVLLTRALRVDGAPTVASRWLQRLLTLAGPDAAAAIGSAGAPYLAHGLALDDAPEAPRIVRPAPSPPAETRPASISVTEVERLFRDPYAYYARRVLRLEPLDPLIRAPGAAERGTLYHAILAEFARKVPEPGGDGALGALLAIARRAFDEEELPPETEAVWWPRMEALAERVVDWERGRSDEVAERRAELTGELFLPDLHLTLRGDADRIDALVGGGVAILDFKTGTSPSVRQARTLLSPQLALEAAMLRAGAFPGFAAGTPVEDLSYVRLREREFYAETLSRPAKGAEPAVTAESLGEEALRRFRGLAAHFLKAENPYPSRVRPVLQGDFSGPYDHLARAREWASGEDDEGDADGVAS